MNDIIKRGVNNYLFDVAFSSSSFASTRAFAFSVSKARFAGAIHHSKAIFLFAPFLRLGSYFGNDSGKNLHSYAKRSSIRLSSGGGRIFG